MSQDPSLILDLQVRLECAILKAPAHFAGGGEALKQWLGVANDISDHRRVESLFVVAGPEDVALFAELFL